MYADRMSSTEFPPYEESVSGEDWKRIVVHISLFVVTFFTATVAGVQWLNKDPFELSNFDQGITYSALMLFMLSAHEFGHYFAARFHGVRVTLPFFIPFPSFLGINPFGTMGAVIRIRSALPSRKVLFDIGAAGPIAGFVVTLAMLIYGFLNLPPAEYLYTIHPEYAQLDSIPRGGIIFGSTLLFDFLASALAPSGAFVPPMNEVYHYPFLCVGWFGMLVTAMNLIPVGQLDGGHISSSMFGRKARFVTYVALGLLIIFGALGFLPLFGITAEIGWTGWLFWAFVLIVFMRSLRFTRPMLPDDAPLDSRRMTLGWVCFLIFTVSFSLTPFNIL